MRNDQVSAVLNRIHASVHKEGCELLRIFAYMACVVHAKRAAFKGLTAFNTREFPPRPNKVVLAA